MESVTKQTCEQFIELLASKSPVPGGGGAAALVAAIGVALGNMVGSLTVGKKKYADVESKVVQLKEQADALQERLLALVAKDAEVFEPLSVAYGLPKNTEEEKTHKDEVMEACLRDCCDVPLAIMEAAAEAIELNGAFVKVGAEIAISDVGCGVVCAKAALQAASLNVFINTKAMQDRDYAVILNAKAQKLLETYSCCADKIYAEVAAYFD